ncbi:MAG: flagellar hook-basal body complex protein [Clostridia bacterium]|mgnify:FL=1|jgi:flagellar basal-body rod protein FlgG|nr:flagellar hook-basal body complex protein [Clostridia bacterium]
MMRSLYSAASGMHAQQLNLDVISNNLANVNTTGFKKSYVDFQSLFYQTIRQAAISSSTGLNNFAVEVGNGVKVAATRTSFVDGGLQQTGNPLDLAIEGKGFFMIQLPNGQVGFTRAGAFRLDSEGYLTNADGCRLLSSQGNASPETSASLNGQDLKYIQPDTDALVVSIAPDGTVITEKNVSNPPVLELANFTNPEGLQAVGSSAYILSEVCGEITIGQPATDAELGIIRSECLEASNVSIVDEMIRMIMAQRAYEIGSKSIQTSDEMLGITNGLKR